jgi:TRAP-type C4-dicarboxylate transport system permease small subunit
MYKPNDARGALRRLLSFLGPFRWLIALVAVCLTFIITIVVFVSGYTQREKNWLDTIRNMGTPAAAEVANGQQNADP